MTKRERVIKLHKYLYPGDTSKHTYIDVTGSDIYIQSEVYSNEREILNKEIFKYVGDPSHFSVYYYLFKESYIYYYNYNNTKYEKLDKDSIIIEYIESHLLQRFENEALDIAKTKVLEELTKNKLESDLELIKINKDFFDKELSKDYEKFDRKRKLDRL